MFHRDLGTASNWWPQGKHFRCGQNNYFSEGVWALLLDGKWSSFVFTHQQWLETGNQYSESFLSESYISRHFECSLKSLGLVLEVMIFVIRKPMLFCVFLGAFKNVTKIISRHWSVFNTLFWHSLTDFELDLKVLVMHICFWDLLLGWCLLIFCHHSSAPSTLWRPNTRGTLVVSALQSIYAFSEFCYLWNYPQIFTQMIYYFLRLHCPVY